MRKENPSSAKTASSSGKSSMYLRNVAASVMRFFSCQCQSFHCSSVAIDLISMILISVLPSIRVTFFKELHQYRISAQQIDGYRGMMRSVAIAQDHIHIGSD